MTLSDLLRPHTKQEVKDRLLAGLAENGFPITDWGEGNVARTLIEIIARESVLFSGAQVGIAGSGFLSTSHNKHLTLLAHELFGINRYSATFAEGRILLSCIPGEGPYNIEPGQLWFSDGLYNFTNTTGCTLTDEAPASVMVRAESPGASHNASVDTITIMRTPLVGVSATNPDNGNGTWPTTQGSDEEPDDLLRQRCRTRWSVLGLGANADWYVYHARTGHPYVEQITRVLVNTDPSGRNAVTVTIGGPNGRLDEDVIAAVATVIRAKMPLTTSLTVQSVENHEICISGVIYAYNGNDPEQIKTRALSDTRDYLATIGIGDTVFLTRIVDALQFDSRVVRNVALTTPNNDIVLGEREVAVVWNTAELVVHTIS